MSRTRVFQFLTAVLAVLATYVAINNMSSAQTAAQPGGGLSLSSCTCQPPKYVRTSGDLTLAGDEDYVEVDNDAGLPITITLPSAPTKSERHEIFVVPQPSGQPVTINPNGQPTSGSGLVISGASEGRVLLYVKPTPAGGGYWRISDL